MMGEGILPELSAAVRELFGSGREIALLTDPVIYRLHGESLERDLSGSGFRVRRFLLPIGALKAKTRGTLFRILGCLHHSGLTREALVVNLGGGAVCDMGTLASALFLWGVPTIHVPTTVLAQADCAVGGKGAINFAGMSNRFGLIRQPSLVWIDIALVKTLSRRHFWNGCAEIIKCAFLDDPKTTKLLSGMRVTRPAVTQILPSLIRMAASLKARLVERDEQQHGPRMFLNYGHTIGHAIEQASGFRYLHGEAVSIGMVAAAELAARLGHMSRAVAEEHRQILKNFSLPVLIERSMINGSNDDQIVESIVSLVDRDKKAGLQGARFVLLSDFGEPMMVSNIARTTVADVVRSLLGSSVRGIRGNVSAGGKRP